MDHKDEHDDSLWDLRDPRVPEAIRRHAARFRTVVRYVAVDGADFILLGEDGEVVDICSLGP